MVKQIRFIAFILLITILFQNANCQDTHIGIWKGTDQNEIGFISLDKEGFSFIVLDGDTLGGKEFTLNGVKTQMTYKIDYSKNPITIDFILIRIDTNQELRKLLGILQFISNREMKIRVKFVEGERPVNFLPDNNDETVILTKMK